MAKLRFYYDKQLVYAALCLIGMGVLMVFSASMVISQHQYGHPYHYIMHQLVYAAMGFVLLMIASRLPMHFWQRYSHWALGASLLLLMVVLVPGIGHSVNGSIRWISLGFIGLQVSECAKLSMILFLGAYIVRQHTQVCTQLMGFLKPMALYCCFALLLLLEPDFGATTVLGCITLGMLFLAGAHLRQFVFFLLLIILALAILAVSAPYRLKRLTTFLDPWAHPFGSGYQLTQSLIAFGRGGLWGVGLGDSVQKLFYLPEAHTDFLFAILAEELGFIGTCGILLLYVGMIWRMFKVGRLAEKLKRFYAAYVAYGIGIWFTMQTVVNIGVNSGMLPTKGLTLPLMSYGGSSLLLNAIGLGVMLRISHENFNAQQLAVPENIRVTLVNEQELSEQNE